MEAMIVGEDPSDSPGGHAACEHRLVEATTEHAIFELGPRGVVRSWPAPAVAMYGYDPDAVVGRHLRVLFGDPADLDRSIDVLLSRASDETVAVDAAHAGADGETFWATTTISPISAGDDLRGYAVICEDTTASRQYEQTLERQNDRLKEFTDILVHDLRNPLQVIHQRLALYRDTGDGDHLDALAETVDRMERLVDDLLRVARQGDVVRDREPTDLEQVIDVAWEGLATADPTLRYESVPSVSADSDRLTQLFENLFRNAVEHGGDDVTVRVGPLADGFFVEDDGPGIGADRDGDVFDHGYSTTEDGTGYGLSVVRTIANAHGWDVVAAEGRDGGARFEVSGVEL